MSPRIVPKCPSRKKRYFTEVDAVAAVARILRGMGKTQKPYQCPHCDNWHLTTVRKSLPMEHAR